MSALRVLRNPLAEVELEVSLLERQMASLRVLLPGQSDTEREALLTEHHALALQRMEILEAAATA